MKTIRLAFFAPLFSIFALFLSILSAQAINIQDVTSPKGIHGWLVEDRTVPIIAIEFSFQGGTTQDPQGKAGLGRLMSGLFDEGAGDLNADLFQARIDDLGAEMAFSATPDTMRGSLRVLAENKKQAFELFALAVQKPRFDQDAIDRIRATMITGIRAGEKKPNVIAQQRLDTMIFGKHPYARRAEGTVNSLEKITREDLIEAHKAVFARDHLHIGIVGPVDAEEAGKIIDQIFAALPERAKLVDIPDAILQLGGTDNVPYDLPQTSLTLVYPGVSRDAPDFFAAYLMNYVLGGGGLSSRLFTEVREKRGLAYSVGSSLMLYDHASALVVSTGTKSSSAEKSLETIREEIKKMVNDGVTAEELADAKSYVIGSYAVNTMRSSSAIASTLVGLQDQKLPIDYIDKRANLINAVTLDDIKAVAKKLLSGKSALLMVGPSSK